MSSVCLVFQELTCYTVSRTVIRNVVRNEPYKMTVVFSKPIYGGRAIIGPSATKQGLFTARPSNCCVNSTLWATPPPFLLGVQALTANICNIIHWQLLWLGGGTVYTG